MSLSRIRIYGDPVLRKKAKPVDPADPGLADLVQTMFESMRAKDGLGLAAPQIGESQRVAVIDRRGTEGGEEDLVLLNPEILVSWGEQSSEEGCLSLPEVWVKIRRARHIKVRYQDLSGQERTIKVSDRPAVAIQHELDHLDGVLLVDRVSSMKRRLLKGKLDKMKVLSEETV